MGWPASLAVEMAVDAASLAGVLLPTEEAVRDVVDAPFVTLDQLGEGSVVTARGSRHELGVRQRRSEAHAAGVYPEPQVARAWNR